MAAAPRDEILMLRKALKQVPFLSGFHGETTQKTRNKRFFFGNGQFSSNFCRVQWGRNPTYPPPTAVGKVT